MTPTAAPTVARSFLGAVALCLLGTGAVAQADEADAGWASARGETLRAALRDHRAAVRAVDVVPGHPLRSLEELQAPAVQVVTGAVQVDVGSTLVVRSDLTVGVTAPEAGRELVFRWLGAGERRKEQLGTVVSVTVNGRPAQAAVRGTVLTVQADRGWAVGHPLVVRLQTEQRVPHLLDVPAARDGYNAEDFGLVSHADGLVALGHALPVLTAVDASGRQDRRALPLNGEHVYAQAADWDVTVDLPTGWTLASGGQVVQTRPGARGRQQHQVVAAAVRDLSMMTGPYLVSRDVTVGEQKLSVLYDRRQPDHAAAAHTVLHEAADALEWFSGALGGLPWPEVELVIAPGRVALGSEYSALATLNLAGIARSDNPDRLAMTTAHEVAHQWWYAEVGSDPIAEPWVDESLATWSAAAWWAHRAGDGAARAQVLSMDAHRSMVALEEAPFAADLPADAYPALVYGPVVYGRGALFFEALAQARGQEAMLTALRRYHREGSGSLVSGEVLLQTLADGLGEMAVDVAWRRWMAPGQGPTVSRTAVLREADDRS